MLRQGAQQGAQQPKHPQQAEDEGRVGSAPIAPVLGTMQHFAPRRALFAASRLTTAKPLAHRSRMTQAEAPLARNEEVPHAEAAWEWFRGMGSPK